MPSHVPGQCAYEGHSPPLKILQMADVQGGEVHWLGIWRVHFDDKSWCGGGSAFLAESTLCKVLFCIHTFPFMIKIEVKLQSGMGKIYSE